MDHTFTCTNGEIRLSPFSAGDSEKYRQLRNKEYNRNCFFFSGVITMEAQRNWYNNYLKKENDYMFSVYDQTGQFLGGAALYDMQKDTAEFGRLLIDRTAAGKSGIGYQVLMLLCRLAKEQFHLSYLHLELFEDNIPARKTYEKAGFVCKKRYLPPNGTRYLNYMEKIL